MGFFEKLRAGLRKTKDSMMGKIEGLLNSFTKIDEDLFEELEETLIMCDIGVNTSVKICDQLRERVKRDGVKDPSMIMDMLREVIEDMLGEDKAIDLSTTPSVILVIGVNGVGKTTTIGKLSYQLKNEGKKVIVAAADTFRAAAIDQLEVWTQRAGVDIIKHNEGSDPAAVVFDALTAAKARKADVVICDTAGRLHNKKNLMDELRKISRIVHQQAEGCSLEVLLALDATTGQNAVNQAKQFNEVADITGIILTKLDGTAKGGIIISITDDLKIPVKLVTVGEKIDDIQPFSSKDFVRALFASDSDFEGNYERLVDEDTQDDIIEQTETDEQELVTEVDESVEEVAEQQAEEEELTEMEAAETTVDEESGVEQLEDEQSDEQPEEDESTDEQEEVADETAEEETDEEQPKKKRWFHFGRKKEGK